MELGVLYVDGEDVNEELVRMGQVEDSRGSLRSGNLS